MYGAISSRPVLEECKGAVRLKGSSLRKYWWDLPMEAPKEEDSSPSGLGAFLGRNAGADGGGGGSSQWDSWHVHIDPRVYPFLIPFWSYCRQ